MKKIIALVMAAVIGAAAFAGEVSVGGRIEGSYDVFYLAEYLDDDGRIPKFNIGGAVWGNFSLVQNGSFSFALQPELGLSFNRGYKKYSKYSTEPTYEISFTQLEVPVLAMFDFALSDRISLGAGLGPYFALGLGYTESKDSSTIETVSGGSSSSLRFKGGVTVAADLGIAAGPGKIILDIRADIPLFGTLSAAGALGAGLGYQYTF